MKLSVWESGTFNEILGFESEKFVGLQRVERRILMNAIGGQDNTARTREL
ncbi:MAG: hypothetical protein AAFX94_12340 [Myxococcota bacterium]